MTSLVDGHWLPVAKVDPRVAMLYSRHYSATKAGSVAGWRRFGITGGGESMVLLTLGCDALFAWLRNTIPRLDGQIGVNCTVFRNEGPTLSSELIREADQLAWDRWPGLRHFTYVAPRKIRSSNPGYCFIQAGWRRCGHSTGGLVLLEIIP